MCPDEVKYAAGAKLGFPDPAVKKKKLADPTSCEKQGNAKRA